MYNKVVILLCIVLALSLEASAQGDPLIDLLQNLPSGAPAPPAEPAVAPCPRDRECVTISSFTKADYKAEAKRFEVGQFTGGRSFDRLVINQHIAGEHGVIVNTVKVKQGGSWVSHSQGLRLPEGRTEFQVPVPAGTREMVISFDHGRGAELTVQLERAAP